MHFSKNKSYTGSLLLVVGLLYPILVYLGLNVLKPGIVVLLALIFLFARTLNSADNMSVLESAFRLIVAATAVLVLATFIIDAEIAVKIYPVSVSLGFAVVFIHSLIKPPPIIERIARIQDPELSFEGLVYTRKVTLIWIVFFIANALVSAWTALYEPRETWVIYNGLISYLLIGCLFAGEFAFRRYFKVR